MNYFKNKYFLPLVSVLLLACLCAGGFYYQNFGQGVIFPNLGDQDSAVDCNAIEKDKLLVLFAVGQSTASNFGSVQFKPDSNVFSFYNGRCFAGADPLPGADGSGGSIWSRLGDLLVKRGYARNVLLVAVGAGGSSVSEWIPDGKYYPRLLDATRSMREAGFKPGLIVWQQGSRDKDMDPDQYRSNLRDFVYSLSFLGVQLGQPTRLLIAKHTRCKSEALPELQAAQDSLVSPGSYIFAGPNMDILGDEMKYDRCHYNEAGLKAATGLWFNAIEMAQRESAWLPMATVR